MKKYLPKSLRTKHCQSFKHDYYNMVNLGCAYNTEISKALYFVSAEDMAHRKDLRI